MVPCCSIVFYIFILATFSFCHTSKEIKTPPKIEFRFVDRNDDSSKSIRVPVRRIGGDTDRELAVKPEIITTGADIIRVKPRTEHFWVMFKRYERSEVRITFSDEGAERLKAAIRNGSGERLAIIIDGAIIEIALIGNEFAGTTLVLEGAMTRAEANEFARRFGKK